MVDGSITSESLALVLQGGGARGAYQVGVLKAVAEITGVRRSPFKIICGSSVGAINAASIAASSNDFQQGTRHLEELWRSLRSSSIYDTRALSVLATTLRWSGTMLFGYLGLRAEGGILDYTPLKDLLVQEFRRAHLERAVRSGSLRALCITASSYNDGRAVTFFEGAEDIEEWSRARRIGKRTVIEYKHLLASSALPFAFSPVRIADGYYGDGSLRSTSPLSPAIRTGASRVFVIGTRDTYLSPLPQAERRSPTIGEVAGHALDILFNDNLEADHERMERINHTVSLLSAEARTKTTLRNIQSILISPSLDLRDVAKPHAGDLPRPVRMLMRSTGAWRSDGRLESYLMFEPVYVGALIDLGYSDTIAKSSEVAKFFALER